jgi:ABC-2 type transport system ATP-binding protein
MVEIEKLNFGYTKKQTLFNQLDLQLEPGNIYGLLGKNGAGKTTLLKVMTGLVFPRDGSCRIAGYDANERMPACLEDICFIPEEYHLPSVKIESYVSINAPFYKRFDYEKLAWLLKEFQLQPKNKLNQLSYGQKKKFLLAFGLSTSARLLLMDEPTNGLDIPSKSQFRKVIAASVNEEQCVLISTHQVRDLENLIDPIIIIDEGRIIFQKNLEQISSKLYFEAIPEIKENQQPLYYEEGLAGYAAITPNLQGKDSRIDIELLFNGVISNTKGINNEFK